jgi:ABC-type multidrug transport system fused ATPase/permease subunit
VGEVLAREFGGVLEPEQFDDRVDLDAEITNREVVSIIARSLKLLWSVKAIFAAKALLALLALIPGLVAPWIGKVVIDQVILGKPVDETLVSFPPHVAPLIAYIDGLAPLETMFAVSFVLVVMLVLLGRDGGRTGISLSTGMDSATLSEAKLNAGSSESGGILGTIEALVHIRLSQRLVNGLRTRLFSGLAKLPMATLDDHRIGDSVYRVMYDAPDVPVICFGLTLQPFFVLLGVGISLYLIQYSYGAVAPELVWVSALLVPLAFLMTLPFSGLMRRVQQAARASGTATTNAIEESMSNIRAVQSLGGSAQETDRIEEKSKESFRRFRHVRVIEIGMTVAATVLTIALAVFVLVYVTNQVIENVMTPGDFSVLFGLTLGIGGAGLQIGMLWINTQGNVAAVRRVFFFIDLESEDELKSRPSLEPLTSNVRFDNVSFHYPNGTPALEDVDLELPLGALIAIVGPTGCGKTTLANMVPGYYRPTRGRVLFDGTDIADVNVESLRSQVSYVFQEHQLLSASIRDNFLLVNPQASDEAMLQACRVAGALEVIDGLPDGLDTVLGRAGDTLSVGQKQRISIARGLVRDTRVLILDEPTAALDPPTENALVSALHGARAGRLVIVIAHRLSTIRRADKIVFLEEGRVLDVGSHDELMAKPGGNYRHFVELQRGGDHE